MTIGNAIRSSSDSLLWEDVLAKDFPYINNNGENNEKQEPLSWRLHNSLSDWTIVVKCIKSTEDNYGLKSEEDNSAEQTIVSTVYNVHKTALAVGPKKSEYFAALFQQSFSEADDSTSYIELEASAADAFPTVLDFMYSPTMTNTDVTDDNYITTNNSVALRYLAKYFQIRELFTKVTSFIRKDIIIKPEEKLPSYFAEALKYNDWNVIQFASDVCAQNIQDAEMEKLVVSLIPSIFQQIITSNALNFKEDNRAVSRIVHLYCTSHSESIDISFLNTVTDCKVMPSIDQDIAGSLLNLYNSYFDVDNSIIKTIGDDPDSENIRAAKNSLEERCIEALATCWEDNLVDKMKAPEQEGGPCSDENRSIRVTKVNKQDSKASILLHGNNKSTSTTNHNYIFRKETIHLLPSHVQTKLLQRSLCNAKATIECLRKEIEGERVNAILTIESQNEEIENLKSLNETMSKELSKVNGEVRNLKYRNRTNTEQITKLNYKHIRPLEVYDRQLRSLQAKKAYQMQ